MKIDEYLKLADRIYKECRELSVNKGHDYSLEEDTLRNLKACEKLGISPAETGIIIRLMDKIMRMDNFSKSGILKVKDESIEDTVKDAHNYVNLWYAVVKEKMEGTNYIINQMAETTKQSKEWLDSIGVEGVKKRLEEAGYEIGKVPLPEDAEFSAYKDKLRGLLGKVLLTELVGAIVVDKNRDDRKAMLLHRLTNAMIDVMGCAK